MNSSPVHVAAELAGAVFIILCLSKACKAFTKSGFGSTRIPVALSACEDALLDRLKLATDVALRAGAAIKEVIHSKKGNVVHKGATDLVTETDKNNEKMIFDALRAAFPDDKLIGEESSAEAGAIESLTDDGTWIVDPVDGTTNFVHGFPMTCVSIAFAREGKVEVGVVYDPCSDELFQTVRGGGAFVNGLRASTSGCTELEKAVVIVEYGYQRDPDAVKTMLDKTEQVLCKSRAIRQVGSGCLDLVWVGCGRADAVYAGVAGEGWQPWDYAAGWLFAEEAGGIVTQIDGKPFHVLSKSIICAASQTLASELTLTIR